MNNMIGIGPFITIPLLMTALAGPQAMLGWIVALVIVLCDGMVWSELGAAMPASGGSFGYLREAYGRNTFGRLMAFLFVWQFILSGVRMRTVSPSPRRQSPDKSHGCIPCIRRPRVWRNCLTYRRSPESVDYSVVTEISGAWDTACRTSVNEPSYASIRGPTRHMAMCST